METNPNLTWGGCEKIICTPTFLVEQGPKQHKPRPIHKFKEFKTIEDIKISQSVSQSVRQSVSQKVHKVPESSRKIQKDSERFRKFRKVSESFGRFRKVSES